MSWRKNDFFTVYKKNSYIQAVAFQMAEGTHSSKIIFDLEPLYRQQNKLLSGHLPAGVEEHA